MSATQATDAPAGQPTARPEQPDVFLSYSRKDSDFARRLGEALAARDKEVWADWEDIPATAEWRGEIASGIDAADSFAFVISPDSIRSEAARSSRTRSSTASASSRSSIATRTASPSRRLASRNWIFFRAEDDFDDAVDTFVEALETDLDWVRAHTRLLVRARVGAAKPRQEPAAPRLRPARSRAPARERLAAGRAPADPAPARVHAREQARAEPPAADHARRGRVALGVTVVLADPRVDPAQRRDRQRANGPVASSRPRRRASSRDQPGAERPARPAGVDQKRTAEAENVLRRALSLTNVIATTVPHRGWVAGVAFSRDGRRLLTASRDATARISDAATGRRLVTFRGHATGCPPRSSAPTRQRVSRPRATEPRASGTRWNGRATARSVRAPRA